MWKALDLALESNNSVEYFCLLECKTWMMWVYCQGTQVSSQIQFITLTIVWTFSNNIWQLKRSSILSFWAMYLLFYYLKLAMQSILLVVILKCGTIIQNVSFQTCMTYFLFLSIKWKSIEPKALNSIDISINAFPVNVCVNV